MSSETASHPYSFKFFNRFPKTWFDFYAMHPILAKTTAALTFLGCLAYGIYRYFFGKNTRNRENSASSSDDEDINNYGYARIS